MNAYEQLKVAVILWFILVSVVPLLAFIEFKLSIMESEKEHADRRMATSHLVSSVICVAAEIILLCGARV